LKLSPKNTEALKGKTQTEAKEAESKRRRTNVNFFPGVRKS